MRTNTERRVRSIATEELLALGVFGRHSRLGERIAILLERGREFSPRASKSRVTVGAIGLLACAIAGAFAPRLVAFAQTQRFEVASVKPNNSGERKWLAPPPAGGRYAVTNMTLQMLVVQAYGLPSFQISGAPPWFDSDRFDVEGKALGNPPKEQIMVMLQSLLADRFKLAVHRENKEAPVFELVVAKGGIKFKEGKCVGEPGFANPCGGFSVGLRGVMVGREVGVDQLASNLGSLLSRQVHDKTGLAGKYDFDLTWTPDGSTIRGPGDPDAPPPDPAGPSIFTALQEQLGLELKSTKAPVEILVIDHVEKPDEN